VNRIELRGAIVSSLWDDEWFDDFIDKGLIMPESRFRAILAEAPTDAPLALYVNSPGGSVFAAYEMINAVREWKAEHKQPVTVIVGAMAASAAASIAIMTGTTIKVHRNSKMMFHGAQVATVGGAESLEDQAELLGKMNADVQNFLIQNFKLDSDAVAEWFAEGREGWLSADEMISAGIAQEIIADDSEVIIFDSGALDAMGGKGLDIAAYLEEMNIETTTPANDNDAQPDNLPDGGQTPATPPGAGTAESDYQRGFKAGQAAGQAAAVTDCAESVNSLKQALEKANALQAKTQSERDKAFNDIKKLQEEAEQETAALNAQLVTMETRIREFIDGSFTHSPQVETWADAMKVCNDDYAEARRRYPDAFRLYLKEANSN